MRITPFRPMLAASRARDVLVEDWEKSLRFPVIATPKIDGIRCVTMDLPPAPDEQSVPVCRSLKQVPNNYIGHQIARYCPPGLDGEIVTYPQGDLFQRNTTMDPFNTVQSKVMSQQGVCLFKYHVFDDDIFSIGMSYEQRLKKLLTWTYPDLPAWCVLVPPTPIQSLSQLLEYEVEMVAAGWEGICFRTPDSPYKHGRSTMREQWLVKMKRFITEEARVIGAECLYSNKNPATLDERGYTERSSHGANMIATDRLGALIVERLSDKAQFKIGTGFSYEDRVRLWKGRDAVEEHGIIGKIVTFKHQPHGSKDVPRIPVFVGFRGVKDLG